MAKVTAAARGRLGARPVAGASCRPAGCRGPQRRRAAWVRPTRAKNDEGKEEVVETPEKAEEPKLTAGGLAELVGLGMGIPVPASVEIDMEKKQLIAEFEANNFGQEQKYRDEGYVDEEAGFNFLTLLWIPVAGGIGYGIYLTLQALS